MNAPTPMQREQHAAEARGALMMECTRCRAPKLLLLRLRPEVWICAACWIRAGRPSLPVVDGHEQEVATRERMLERGGADAYRVKAGKS